MFYCKSSMQTSCSDVHWNFWRMCNALQLGSKVCNWYRLAISPIWRRRSTIKCLKKASLLFCILHPACILLSVCSLHFSPGLQSAVCSPQSTVFLLHWPFFFVFWEPPWCSRVCCWYIWQTSWFCFKALKSPCSQLTVFIFWLLVHKTDQSTLWVIQVIHVFLLHGGNSLFHLTLILTLLFVF